METYLFVLFATLAIASALAMVISKNTVHSALYLVLNLMSVAGVFLLLKAQFLAVIQVLVYAGAIMVLFLFVIMLLNVDDEEGLFTSFRFKYLLSFLLGVVILANLLFAVGSLTDTLPAAASEMAQAGTVEALGDELFRSYLVPFEVTAILLTAAIVGALLMAQRKFKNKKDDSA